MLQMFCQGMQSCEYDYVVTGRREIALDTMTTENMFLGMKEISEQHCNVLEISLGIVISFHSGELRSPGKSRWGHQVSSGE